MAEIEPKTREEKLWNGEDIEPVTREEMYIKHIFDNTQIIPDHPITRKEMLMEKAGEGGGGDITIKQLIATENKTYSEEGTAYSPVIVNVPDVPPVLDELTVTENGTYTPPSGTDGYDEVTVSVPLPPNAYLLKEIENVAIASFDDGADLPMPKLKVAIEPQQEGSGDPSPTNIRPINGWDECNVTRCGKNLFDVSKSTAYKVMTENGETDNGSCSHSDYIKALPNTLYFLSNSDASSAVSIFCNYDKDKNFINYSASAGLSGRLRQTLANTAYIVVNYRENIKNEMMICMSSIEETYEPYNGQTYTIDLDGTRYGGELDVVSGVLTLTHGYIASYNGEALPSTWISDRDVYAEGTTPTIGAEVVYELATPQNIQLTPTMVKSLVGQNNVWADTGDILEASYFAKEVSA